MRLRRSPFFALLVLLLAAAAQADPPSIYAIVGGTVHPASGPEIANGVVIVRGGLIEAVGANLAVPADAALIDAKGAHVYPGLIDAQTSAGFPSAKPSGGRRRGGASRPAAQPESLPQTSAAFVAASNVRFGEDERDAIRRSGVTTILTAPSFGIFNGQSAVLNLGDGPAETMVVKSPAAVQISFTPRPSWTFPDSLMGVIADIRQTMLDAQHYAVAHAIYEKNPSGLERPESDDALAALGPVLTRAMPVVFVADSELMMRRASAIAREFNLRYILSGARQGYRMPDELKRSGAPLLVSVNWPKPPASKEDREEQPLRVIRDRALEPTTPAALAKSGVTFALVSGSGKPGDFLGGIRTAIEHGLAPGDALLATTLWPARILGVDRQLGSLERGKIANVIVTDKPLFEKNAKVTHLLVDGRELRLPAEEKKLAADGTTSAIDGSWSLVVRTSQGDVAITATFHQENGRLTGTYSGEKGSGDIRNGSFEGNSVEFTLAMRGQQETESSDWVFRGTLDGTSMSGAVDTSLGTFAFTGSKGQ